MTYTGTIHVGVLVISMEIQNKNNINKNSNNARDDTCASEEAGCCQGTGLSGHMEAFQKLGYLLREPIVTSTFFKGSIGGTLFGVATI